MSYFDDASLVMIPSGYKTSKVYSVKPTDGSGDLDFTRTGDTATRVNSAGLIEKVRTNVALYSEDLSNAAWPKNRSTITANALANPVNGATTADYIVEDTASGTHEVIQLFTVSSGVSYTVSAYAKADTRTKVALVLAGSAFASGGNGQAIFNLATGAVISAINGATARISDAGNGWYRCSITKASIDTTGVIALELVDVSDNTSYTGDGTSRAAFFGAQFEISDFGATPYIPTTTAAVSVGPVANVPRLDYLGSSCPRLNLEPQRTNYQLYSENSAQWLSPADGITVAYNTTETLDPSGYYGAEKVTAVSGNKRMFDALTNPSGAFTMSAFVKAGTGDVFLMRTTSASVLIEFNLTTLAITAAAGTGTITSYGNGWYRCTASTTSAIAFEVVQYQFLNDANEYMYFFGAQAENGAYATSYVPTTSASVTRVADAASKTGISSLIGQTEGTIFVEEEYDATVFNNGGIDDTLVALTDGTSSNMIAIFHYGNSPAGFSRLASFFIRVAGATQASINSTALSSGTYKMAFAYKNNDVVAYINGVQIGTDTSATIPATSVVTLVDPITTNAATKTVRESQVLLFKTRLTNAELAELTTL